MCPQLITHFDRKRGGWELHVLANLVTELIVLFDGLEKDEVLFQIFEFDGFAHRNDDLARGWLAVVPVSILSGLLVGRGLLVVLRLGLIVRLFFGPQATHGWRARDKEGNRWRLITTKRIQGV